MKLMALTFVRTSELIGARWEEFDFEARRWDIPAERMKMKTPHIVPLSSQAIEVLELLRTISGDSELVFPGEQRRKQADVQHDHPEGAGAHGLQRPHDWPRLPWACIHDPA